MKDSEKIDYILMQNDAILMLMQIILKEQGLKEEEIVKICREIEHKTRKLGEKYEE